MELLDKVKKELRLKNIAFDDDIKDLIEACKKDLELSGVNSDKTDENSLMDPLIERAIKLYCKGSFGYDENSDKYMGAYASLKDAMALSGEYRAVT